MWKQATTGKNGKVDERYISDLRVVDILTQAICIGDVTLVYRTFEDGCKDETFSGMNEFCIDRNRNGGTVRNVFTRIPEDEQEKFTCEPFCC